MSRRRDRDAFKKNSHYYPILLLPQHHQKTTHLHLNTALLCPPDKIFYLFDLAKIRVAVTIFWFYDLKNEIKSQLKKLHYEMASKVEIQVEKSCI